MGLSLAAQHFVDTIHDNIIIMRSYASDGYEQKIKKFDTKRQNFWLKQTNSPISFLDDAGRYKFLSVILQRNITSSKEVTNVEAHVINAVYFSFPYDLASEIVMEIVNSVN